MATCSTDDDQIHGYIVHSVDNASNVKLQIRCI